MKFVVALFALAVGSASAQDASNFPSGSSFPSLTPSTMPSAVETPSPLAPTSESGLDVLNDNFATYNTLITALANAGLDALLSDASNELTLFAPSNTAFGALVSMEGSLFIDLFTEPFEKHLECFLRSHLVEGVITSNVLGYKPDTLTTLSGFEISVGTSGGVVVVDGQPLSTADIPSSNGVVHFLNTLPILAPCVSMTIAAQTLAIPTLSTTVARIILAGLVEFITTESPLTFLAPTDEAWEKLPDNIKSYLATNTTALAEVIKYHIFGGVNLFASVVSEATFTTSGGDIVNITNVNGVLGITGQTDVGTSSEVPFLSIDVLAQNGVFHVINEVLIPRSLIFPTFIICFPGDSIVDIKGVGKTLMKDVKIGDEVMTSSGTYDKIYSFGHNQPDVVGEYLQLSTKETTKPLQLSKDHMVFVDSSTSVPAGSLKVGDAILLDTGKSASITKVSTVYSVGAYAPFTESGSIVVDGVVASSYVAMDEKHHMLTLDSIELPISYQWMSHASQAPHRLYCGLFKCENETYSADGVSQWVDAPYRAGKFMLEQHMLLQMLAFLVLVPAFGACALVDLIVKSPVTVVAGAVGVYSLTSTRKLRLTSRK